MDLCVCKTHPLVEKCFGGEGEGPSMVSLWGCLWTSSLASVSLGSGLAGWAWGGRLEIFFSCLAVVRMRSCKSACSWATSGFEDTDAAKQGEDLFVALCGRGGVHSAAFPLAFMMWAGRTLVDFHCGSYTARCCYDALWLQHLGQAACSSDVSGTLKRSVFPQGSWEDLI